MGYMRHHAILVTSWNEPMLTEAHAEAVSLFDELVSGIVHGAINGEDSFFVAPDGSKEGWTTSTDYDIKRDLFIEWCRSKAYEDGSNCLAWAEVQYGDDNNEAAVLRSRDQDEARNYAGVLTPGDADG